MRIDKKGAKRRALAPGILPKLNYRTRETGCPESSGQYHPR
jgi:hypothetical protein